MVWLLYWMMGGKKDYWDKGYHEEEMSLKG
jgi:hypothetical protein